MIGGAGVGGREKMLHALLEVEQRDPQLGSVVFFLKKEGAFLDRFLKLGIRMASYHDFQRPIRWYRSIKWLSGHDVLVLHTFHWKLAILAVLSGIPIVFRLSGLYLLVRRSLWSVAWSTLKRMVYPLAAFRKRYPEHIQDAQILPLNTAVVNTPDRRSFKRLLRRWQFIVFLRVFCRLIIVNSQYVRNSLKSKYYVPKSKGIRIIPNGISLESGIQSVTPRKEWGVAADEFLVGTVARFDVRKRIDRLLEAFVPLGKKPGYRLVIVGNGDILLEKQFRDFVERHGLTDRVIFAGFRNDVHACMETMNLFVLPSDNESFPNALMEAMLLARPCVAFHNSGGPTELIRQADTGFLVHNTGDIAPIAELLKASPERALAVGRSASNYIRRHYSMDLYARRYKDAYFELANGN